MLNLNTGNPGSGKTLSMVQDLKKLVDTWEAKPEEARPLFVVGIANLAIPHSELPLKSVVIGKSGSPRLVPDWDAMPDHSLVIIDECQGFFPPRSSGSQIPDHVAFLNTHRHRGFDIWLTTQNPLLLDINVRKIVGRHRYFRRLFGKGGSMVYEWDECSDTHRVKNAVSWLWKFPSNVFDLYKSAEVHTKQTFRKPWWLWIFPVAILGALWFFPSAYKAMSGEIDPAPQKSSLSSALSPKASGSAAGLPAAQAAVPFVGYMRQGGKCFGVLRNGETVKEPVGCSQKL